MNCGATPPNAELQLTPPGERTSNSTYVAAGQVIRVRGCCYTTLPTCVEHTPIPRLFYV